MDGNLNIVRCNIMDHEETFKGRFVKEFPTGIKDKKRIEIYQGDIIKYSNKFESGIGVVKALHDTSNLVVEWKEQQTSKPSVFTSIIYLQCEKELEIIGNINIQKKNKGLEG